MLAWLSSSEKTTPRARERRDRADVGEIARAEQQRRLAALELRQAVLELAVKRHRARDQPRGAGAGAEALGGLTCGLAHPGVIGETEVVVRAQQQHLGAVEQHARPLRPLDQPQPPVQPRAAKLRQALGDVAHSLVAPAGGVGVRGGSARCEGRSG